LVSFLDEEGRPSVVEKAIIVPPHSSFGTITEDDRRNLIYSSPMFQKYNDLVDRESAYELLQTKLESKLEAEKNLEEQKQQEKELKEQEKLRLAEEKAAEKERKELEKARIAEEKAKEKAKKNNPLNKVAKSTMTTITGTIGRSIARGLLGGIKKFF